MFKKSIIMGVAAIGAMSLVGTGFAGWVIAKTASAEKGGNIKAYTAVEESLTVATAIDHESIIFGKPSGYTEVATAWLKPETSGDGAVADEVKNATITLTITGIPEGKKAYTSFKVVLPDLSEVSSLVTFTVSVGQTVLTAANDGAYYSYNNEGASPAVTIAFDWSTTAFPDGNNGSLNPYTYYAAQAYTDALAAEALARLNKLESELNGKTFTVYSRSSTAKTAENPSIFAAAPAQD